MSELQNGRQNNNCKQIYSAVNKNCSQRPCPKGSKCHSTAQRTWQRYQGLISSKKPSVWKKTMH